MSDQRQSYSTKGAPVFPYYIDEEMVTSFLATIEGGLSIVEKVSQTFGSAHQGSVEGGINASGGIPLFGHARVSGNAGRKSESTSGEQWEFERQHTMISLLNLLRQLLLERSIAKVVAANSSMELEIGDIVEFQGSLHENPFVELKQFWETYLKMRPLIPDAEVQQAATSTQRGNRSSQKSQSKNNSAKPISEEDKMIQTIVDMSSQGIEESGLLDVHIETDHSVYEHAVLTLRLDSSPAKSLAYSKGSRCTVIGKITGIAEEEAPILMYRRSGLRYFNLQIFEDAFRPLRNIDELNIDFGELAVPAPAIQVLPLAIFV